MEFHQAVVSTLRDSEDAPEPAPLPPNIQHNPLVTHTNEDMARLCDTHGDLDSNQNDDEADNGKCFEIYILQDLNLSIYIFSFKNSQFLHRVI